MENSGNKEVTVEKKIDAIYDYILTTNITEIDKQAIHNKRKREKAARDTVNRILCNLPKLEKFASIKSLNDDEMNEIIDTYFSSEIMKTKNKVDKQNYAVYKDELRNKVKTRLFLDRVYSTLDKYLEQAKNDNVVLFDKYSEKYDEDMLSVKKTILRKMYGYKLADGETKCKSREALAEELGFDIKTIYRRQKELLDDLAPEILGINGFVY